MKSSSERLCYVHTFAVLALCMHKKQNHLSFRHERKGSKHIAYGKLIPQLRETAEAFACGISYWGWRWRSLYQCLEYERNCPPYGVDSRKYYGPREVNGVKARFYNEYAND